MTTEPFTDEILSAIIDGEADQETVASVANDPEASLRLAQLRRAVDMVATPPEVSSTERRSASIAAAMAAANPAPEVSSLAAARHVRTVEERSRRIAPQWLAVAAAAIFLVVAIPLLSRLGGSDSADTATSAADSTSLAANDLSDDASAASDEGGAPELAGSVADSDSADDTADAADEVVESAEEPADTLATDDEAGDDSVAAEVEPTSGRFATAPIANNLEILNGFVSLGTLTPSLTAEDVISEGVDPACVEPLVTSEGPSFDVAILDEFGGGPRVVLVSFAEDGTTMFFDIEDCSSLG